jgi:hypothetical protein
MTTFSTSNATKAVVSLMLVAAAVIAAIQGMSTMNAQVRTIWMGWAGMGWRIQNTCSGKPLESLALSTLASRLAPPRPASPRLASN